MTILIGLDLETSSDKHETGAPIQIGMATGGGSSFGSLVGGWRWEPNYNDAADRWWEWNPESAAVHRILKSDLEAADPANVVDMAARQWLDGINPTTSKFKMVGWGVGNYDAPFVREYFPLTYERFRRQYVDLNGAVAVLAKPNVVSEKRLKRDAKEYAEYVLGRDWGWGPGGWHDAKYDAIAAMLSFQYLQDWPYREGRP